MDLFDFINKYWTILAGIASFIGVVVLTRYQADQHSKALMELELKHFALEEKFNVHKDKITESINLIQQDIREIMTILKRDK